MTPFQVFGLIAGSVMAALLLLMVAFPAAFMPKEKRYGKVGPSYWGVYEDSPTEDKPEETVVQLQPAAPKLRIIGGSTRYEAGISIGRSLWK